MQSIKRIFILLLLFSAASVFAHFQMIYTPTSVFIDYKYLVFFYFFFRVYFVVFISLVFV